MHGLGQNLYSACECSVPQASGSGETLFQFRYVFVLFFKKPCIGSSTHKCEGDMCMLIFALGMYEYTYR